MPTAKKKCRWSLYTPVADELPTIEPWIPILARNYCVDKEAIKYLKRLATQYGMEGYKEANAIIGKLMKKQNDDIVVFRPSAFVTKSVKNVERKLQKARRSPIVLI